MDERIRERLASDDITARTFHSLALHIIQQGSKKVPTISKLESDDCGPPRIAAGWQKQCQEEKAQAKGWRLWLEEDGLATAGGGLLCGTKRCSGGWPAGLTAG